MVYPVGRVVDPASSIFIQYFIQHLLTGKSIMEGLQIG